MYLKSIEIHGFKSFADKIRMEFLNGITGIVGPNGSGKSNVADAVRWVLGEQSARQLRGASMQDVIFAGTEIRKPMGYAYVAICIDNADRSLAAEYDEVTVTRRVYRSGESEYLINGSECRLRDIHELFYDTGIGKEGYSIIGQGQIDRILSGKPEERRELFDEAAGIVKFKKRKDTALKKLESEKANLVRLNDILSEVERQVEPLQKQSEAAKVYLKKKETLKVLDANVFLIEESQYEKQIAEIGEKYELVCRDTENIEKEIAESKKRFDEAAAKVEELNGQIDKMRSDISDSAVQKGKIDAEIQVLNEQLRSIASSDEHFLSRLKTVDESIEAREKDLLKQQENKKGIDEKVREAEDSGKDSREELMTYDRRIEELNRAFVEKRKLVVDTIEARGTVRATAERLKTMLEQAQIRQAELNSRLIQQRSSEAAQNETIEKYEEELKTIAERLRVLDEEIAGGEVRLSEIREKLEEADQKERQIEGEYREKKTRLESLKNIAERYEGYGNAVRVVMGRKNQSSGICGVVADLIKVEGKYETAIETALGANLQNVVVQDDQAAKKLIEYLKQERAGRVTFLPLSSIQKRDFNAPEALKCEGVIGMADTLVQVDKKYRIVAQNLLGNYIIVDTVDHALALARQFRFTLRIVTLAGEALNPGGSISGGSYKSNSNLLGRQREIDELSGKLKELLNSKDEVLARIEELRDERTRIRTENEKKTEKLQEEQLRLNTAKLNLDAANAKKKDAVSGAEDLAKESKQMEEQLRQIREEQNKNTEEMQLSEQREKEADEDAARLSAELEKLNNESEALRKTVNELSMRHSQFVQQQEFAAQNIERVENEKAQLLSEKKSIGDNLKNNAGETEEKKERIRLLQETLKSADGMNVEKNEELKKKEEERDKVTAAQQELFNERDAILSRKAGLDKERFRLETMKEKAESASESLTQYMWEEYELTLITCREFTDPKLGSLADMKKDTVRLRGELRQLGEVNVNAIDEYRELMERYTFLTGQRDDIIKAGEDLKNIIRDLDDAMRRQFTEQFAEIKKQFDIVFREMFGGGKGTLELVEEEDVLEAGITITAQPPGKKLQNMMQLSGGEKALTAIALLFAIQNLKPSPFCLLDEIEAALDEANVDRFAGYLSKLTKRTQFIVITHRRGTMVKADRLYGITMQEKGVSTQVAVNLNDENYK